MTRSSDDFWNKVEWEGGIEGAIDYGIPLDEYDIPDELKHLWIVARDALDAIREFEPEE